MAIVTPGYDFADGELLTPDKLRLIARPAVAIGDGEITPAMLGDSATAELGGTAGKSRNFLRNGNFAEPLWAAGFSAVTAPAGVRTFRADYWFVKPTGGAVRYEREETGPDYKSLHSARITGASGVTTVDFGQDVPRHIAAALQSELVLSFQVYNNTGSPLTPQVVLATANAPGDFSSVSEVYSEPVESSTTSGTWKRYVKRIDARTLPEFDNGLRVAIRLAGSAMGDGARWVRFAQIKLEVGPTDTGFMPELDRADPTAVPVKYSYHANGNFNEFQWNIGDQGIALPEAVDSYRADGWWARPAGAAGMLYQRVEGGPNNRSVHVAKLTGSAGVSVVYFGQNIERQVAGLLHRELVWSAQVYNGTGADFTPNLRLDTPNTANDFEATTNRLTAALQPCAAGVWTKLTHAFDGGALVNIDFGLRIYIEFPFGVLGDAAKTVSISQVVLEEGPDLSAFNPNPEIPREVSVIGAESGLVISRESNRQVLVKATEVGLKNHGQRALLARDVNALINMNVVGANGRSSGVELASTWYHIYVISDGFNERGLLDRNLGRPTLPAGYNYYARVGSIFNDASSNFADCIQFGRRVFLMPVEVVTSGTASTAADTYQSVFMPGAVPPTAKGVFGRAGTTTAIDAQMAVAGTEFGLGAHRISVGKTATAYGGYYAAGYFSAPLRTPRTLWWKAATTAAAHRIEIEGYWL